MITPLHLLELMWYTYRNFEIDGKLCHRCSKFCSRHGKQIDPNRLEWWLRHYSELNGKVARMKPYQQLTIKSEEVESVSRKMIGFIWGEATCKLALDSTLGRITGPYDSEVLQYAKGALAIYETNNHPKPASYFLLQFDQIQTVLRRASSTKATDLTDWGVTRHLWKNEYMYERSQPVPVKEDTPACDWAYNISTEELPKVLLA